MRSQLIIKITQTLNVNPSNITHLPKHLLLSPKITKPHFLCLQKEEDLKRFLPMIRVLVKWVLTAEYALICLTIVPNRISP